jgi:hypothetical protein
VERPASGTAGEELARTVILSRLGVAPEVLLPPWKRKLEIHHFFGRQAHVARHLGTIEVRVDHGVELEAESLRLGETRHVVELMLVRPHGDGLELQWDSRSAADPRRGSIFAQPGIGDCLVGLLGGHGEISMIKESFWSRLCFS